MKCFAPLIPSSIMASFSSAVHVRPFMLTPPLLSVRTSYHSLSSLSTPLGEQYNHHHGQYNSRFLSSRAQYSMGTAEGIMICV